MDFRGFRVCYVLLFAAFLLSSCAPGERAEMPSSGWPEQSSVNRPWTYWWWPGSAVSREDITVQLEGLAATGMGGVHIIPIYGVKGEEERFIPFLSDEWMAMLDHCIREADRLGMGVDMTSGTGWPFGGPQVTKEDAAKKVRIEGPINIKGSRLTNEETPDNKSRRIVENGQLSLTDGRFVIEFEKDIPQNAVVFLENGDSVIIDQFIDRERKQLVWDVIHGSQDVYFVYVEGTGQQVKRAAPGGEGNVLDYFSRDALGRYLAAFDDAIDRNKTPSVRAYYNDSFEVYNSNWTDDLLRHFQDRYQYDLRLHLPALAGKAGEDENRRVAHDYNEIVSELLLDQFTRPWVRWSNERGSVTRSQSHGSPGNLLDLYAAADIPETEAFGPSGFPIPGLRVDSNIPEHFGKPDYFVEKFASSAAHVTGKKLVSSESCTWLGEHFQVSLSQVKPEIDALFLAGINHVFFHGMAYSPPAETWPGWLFYASTNFAHTGSFWHDLPELTGYIARCQSFLQMGEADNDVLLYWPVHDRWMSAADKDMLHHFQVHNANEWLHPTPFYTVASELQRLGCCFDYVSDSQLADLADPSLKSQAINNVYRAIVVPQTEFMPPETFESLIDLAEQGMAVIFAGNLPGDVPGFKNLEEQRSRFEGLKSGLLGNVDQSGGIGEVKTGKGRILIGGDAGLESLADMTGMLRESCTEKGLGFIRRRSDDGFIYFLSNNGQSAVREWITLSRNAKSMLVYDAVSGRYGQPETRSGQAGNVEVFLSLEPGESRIIRTFDDQLDFDRKWHEYEAGGESIALNLLWTVDFIEGGPELPESAETDELASWTVFGAEKAEAFHGTARYSAEFKMDDIAADNWLLDLGSVRECARVRINGRDAGSAWCFPFSIRVGEFLKSGKNSIEIEVTNLASNRIRALDSASADWKKFYDINYVNIRYEKFDASKWPLMDSGLLGPVRLIPLSEK